MRKYKILYIMVISILLALINGGSASAAEKTDRQITIVEVPQNLNFYLDPFNQKGRGQIYSDKYKIQNGGKEEVTFSIEMALSVLDAETAIMFCQEEWFDGPADRSIYMYVLFEGQQIEDKYVLTNSETICKESVILQPAGEDGDTVYISFGGILSQSGEWKSGELAINCLYNMSSVSMGYMVSVEGEHIRIENDISNLESGKNAELYLIPEEEYALPAKIKVYMNDTEIEVPYDAATGRVFLENVNGNVIIYANGITRAKLPDEGTMNPEKKIWTWTAEEGIQAYEYSFLFEEETVKSGRLGVVDGNVNWDWSEGLEDGEYQLLLKAIGDTIHCLNSEEMYYQITVNQEVLRADEGEEQKPSGGSEGEDPDQPENTDPSQPSGGNEGEDPDQPENTDPSQPSEGNEGKDPDQPENTDPSQPSEGNEGKDPDQPENTDPSQPSEGNDTSQTEGTEPMQPSVQENQQTANGAESAYNQE